MMISNIELTGATKFYAVEITRWTKLGELVDNAVVTKTEDVNSGSANYDIELNDGFLSQKEEDEAIELFKRNEPKD